MGKPSNAVYNTVLFLFFALCIIFLEFFDILSMYMVFVLAALSGLVQPSEIVVRNSLIGDRIPKKHFMKTTSFARIFRALVSAGLFSWLGLAIFVFLLWLFTS